MPLELGRSPLTDLRALLGSAAFHGALVIICSLFVLRAVLPGRASEEEPPGLVGEIGPVDNRASGVAPGGGPGDLGGTLTPEQMERLGPMVDVQATTTDPNALADSLIDEILATPTAATPNENADPLPLPEMPGVGVLPGPGTGGGGGDGGGSGGGQGQGIGAGTEFFGAKERATSFVYVIDRSASMTNRSSIDMAKRELLASLRRLPADARFGVVFYNERANPFLDAAGQPRLMPADSANKARFESRLAAIPADGGTNHVDALLAAYAMKPEVIFFLTDADDMTDREAEQLIRAAGSIRVQAIEFGIGPDSGLSVPLRTLANATGGGYRYINVMTFAIGRFSSE
ncbi:VWA domain-containing protein [Tautonia marina]|uniref:VWA domain-containing protein n=1 Tax=Tautonia marina TaxID=2653855 RepID=UPI00126083E8|nr:VWA domain-containing protein [Tautonia marina]